MRQTYPEMIRFRAPANFSALIVEAASENYQSLSDYMRQLVIAEIGSRPDGRELLRDARRPAARPRLAVSQPEAA